TAHRLKSKQIFASTTATADIFARTSPGGQHDEFSSSVCGAGRRISCSHRDRDRGGHRPGGRAGRPVGCRRVVVDRFLVDRFLVDRFAVAVVGGGVVVGFGG